MEADEQISLANASTEAAELEKAKLAAEEAARKQRFGFLQSTFSKEKAALQEKLDATERDLKSRESTAISLQEV